MILLLFFNLHYNSTFNSAKTHKIHSSIVLKSKNNADVWDFCIIFGNVQFMFIFCKEAECDTLFVAKLTSRAAFLQSCGFGCQLHTLAQCFTLAYGFQRTLLVSTEDWNYQVGPEGWEYAFQPVSETCRQTPDQMSVFWRGKGEELKKIKHRHTPSYENV
jgi:Alpha-(1,6)-fucosyltransferase N- and catalytic domains